VGAPAKINRIVHNYLFLLGIRDIREIRGE
jgi:hypothetical protein